MKRIPFQEWIAYTLHILYRVTGYVSDRTLVSQQSPDRRTESRERRDQQR